MCSINLILIISCIVRSNEGFVINPNKSTILTKHLNLQLNLARKRRGRTGNEDNDRWYESVSEDSTSNEIFWEEMERDKLLNQIGDKDDDFNDYDEDTYRSSKLSTALDMNSLERILSQYNDAMVDDNYLDDDYEDEEDDEDLLELKKQQDMEIEQQLRELEEQEGEDYSWYEDDFDEPWSNFNIDNSLHIDTIDEIIDDDEYIEQMKKEEQFHLAKLSKINLKSARLEKVKKNPKAQQYFEQIKPNDDEGYDKIWVSAIDEATKRNLIGLFGNYGVEFADNFADWTDVNDDNVSIEDIASYKARTVFNVTGLPCIASRTSFEIEPVRSSSTQGINPRVLSGYRFNNIGGHIDQLIETLLPHTDPTRITRFRTCVCFYDGTMEIFDYGECDVDIFFSNSLRTYIPISSAFNSLCNTLQVAYGLQYQSWLQQQMIQDNDNQDHAVGPATIRLRDKVLQHAHVLSNTNIIDVSHFMDSYIDAMLLDECAQELAKRFINHKPTKIVTLSSSGLALPIAKYLQVPIIHAHTQRSMVTTVDTLKVTYKSNTFHNENELHIQTKHFTSKDKILIIDDFLSSGTKKEALIRLLNQCDVSVIGIGVFIEKLYMNGRQYLTGYDMPVIESLVSVVNVKDGIIQLLEEGGFDNDNEKTYQW